MSLKKSIISGIVIAKNEQERIEKCLEALSFCDELILVDNGSIDDTILLAKKRHAIVIEKKDATFSDLRNIAQKRATGEWLLYVDSDEIISDELAVEIRHCISHWQPSEPQVYELHRNNYYLGTRWPHQEWMARLFHKDGLIKWSGALHETPQTQGALGRLEGELLHYTHRSLEQMVAKTNTWSDVEAQLRFDTDHPIVSWWRLLRVMITAFLNSFVTQGGWRAGTVGLIESMYQSFSMFITYAKLWEMQQKKK